MLSGSQPIEDWLREMRDFSGYDYGSGGPFPRDDVPVGMVGLECFWTRVNRSQDTFWVEPHFVMNHFGDVRYPIPTGYIADRPVVRPP